jgi:type I restriction enzyme S subunit
VPTGWKVTRLDAAADVLFSNVDKHTIDGELPIRLCNYVDVYKRDYITSGIDFMVASATREEIRRFSLARGDVLVTKDSEEWNDIAVPALVDEELPGVLCGYHLAQVRPDPRQMVGEYLARAFAAQSICDQFRVAANGITRFGLSVDGIASGWFPVPPVEEQKAIGQFLRRETARIDSLVKKKRRLIDLLREKRTALISRAVTKGLNPAAPMKSSGIPWVGEMPGHWQARRVKYIARIGNGSTPDRENADYWWNGTHPWLNSSVVNLEEVTAASDFVTDLALRECHLPHVTPPAVLVGITGEGKTRGMATLLGFEATINQHLAFIAPRAGVSDVGYLRRLFDTVYDFLRNESDGGGSTKGAITCEQLGNLQIPHPPHSEQVTISEYIKKKTARIDQLSTSVQAAMTRIAEYRSALVSSAVTGKIDVRECGEVPDDDETNGPRLAVDNLCITEVQPCDT